MNFFDLHSRLRNGEYWPYLLGLQSHSLEVKISDSSPYGDYVTTARAIDEGAL